MPQSSDFVNDWMRVQQILGCSAGSTVAVAERTADVLPCSAGTLLGKCDLAHTNFLLHVDISLM
jgi:hypothetical protein